MRAVPVHPATPALTRAPGGARRWWPRLRKLLTLLLVAAVLALIASRARSIDWHEVGEALRGYEAWRLAVGALLAAASYGLYGCYDLLGRAYARHKISSGRVITIGMVVYAFNLNFGGLVGSLGTRMRLYSRAGLRAGEIGGILGMAVITNWLGFVFLAGCVFLASDVPLPLRGAEVGEAILGVVLLGIAGAYLAACAWSKRRTFRVRGYHMHLPSARMALTQLALSSMNWMVMALIIWLMLKGSAPYVTVLGVMLAASIASLITHVPGGLGVVEAIFVAALGETLGDAFLLAGIVAYRAVYFLLPLPFAGVAFAVLEGRAQQARAPP